MAVENKNGDGQEVQNDEEWLIRQAKQCIKTDIYAAKAWLLTARTLFPKSFKIQFEAYAIEKDAKNIKEAAVILEDMFRNFPQEAQLWQEVKTYSDALQSEATDERTVFLKNVFEAFPAKLQYHILVNVAETTKDVLQQCQLMLLILEKYPEQFPTQGMKLIDLLLSTEMQHQPLSPVNCYRKYLVCHVLPEVLKSSAPILNKHLYCWLQKSVEFYMCYITQPPTAEIQPSADLQSPTSQRSTKKILIPGLTEKESYIDRPWEKLFSLLETIGKLLEWDMTGLFGSTNCSTQWQRIHTLWENISEQTESDQSQQVLFCTTILLLYCLYKYACQTEPQQFAVALPSNTAPCPVVLVEAIKLESISLSEPMPKKLKRELTPPELTVSTSIGNANELTDAFLTAVRCWQLLHSRKFLSKEFSKLMQHWQSHTWSWLNDFQTDLLVYQGFYKDALLQLQHTIQQRDASSQMSSARALLQAACCHYCLGNYAQACEHAMKVVSCLPVSTEPPTSLPRNISEGRQVQLLSCKESEVFPYCVQLLITSFMEKVFNASMPDDMSLGHMVVLMQYDWSKYEHLFCEVLHKIHQQGYFTYNLFFNYVTNIDILEEFAYLKIHEGGRINLDILPTSTKQIVQTRTVTRGVNKGVKQDFQAALEKQVMRSEENIESIIRQFLVEEHELLLHHLM